MSGTAVTQHTRRALHPSSPGTVTGAPPLSTGLPVEADAPAADGAPGSVPPLAGAGNGTDRPRVRPGGPTAARGPQLVLTIGDE